MGSSALPADYGVRRLVRSARGWGGGFSRDPSSPPANVVVAWCRSRKPSADRASGSEVGHFSCRRPQVVAGNNLGTLTGQLGCRESAKGVDAGQPGETRSHRFKPGSSFEQVIELYNRDRLIRLLVIDAIERIEIAARSAWVQEMSMKHGPHCYLDPLLFRSDFNHGEQLEQLRSQLQQSNETFVIHYRQTYSEPELPPIWAMTELISLGTLRAWIAATELDSKTKVARSLGMPSAQVLNGVLHSLNLLRNISAHHGRLWNRLIVKRLPKIKKLQNLLVLEDVDGEGMQPSKKLYNYLVVMAIIVRKVAPLSTWPSRMAVVMSEMAPEQQGAMGCPVGWQQQQIWS